jgi:hypothetical protein
MADDIERTRNKGESSTRQRGNETAHKGGDHIRRAKEWGGGSQGSKGKVTREDKRDENSAAKS